MHDAVGTGAGCAAGFEIDHRLNEHRKTERCRIDFFVLATFEDVARINRRPTSAYGDVDLLGRDVHVRRERAGPAPLAFERTRRAHDERAAERRNARAQIREQLRVDRRVHDGEARCARTTLRVRMRRQLERLARTFGGDDETGKSGKT